MRPIIRAVEIPASATLKCRLTVCALLLSLFCSPATKAQLYSDHHTTPISSVGMSYSILQPVIEAGYGIAV